MRKPEVSILSRGNYMPNSPGGEILASLGNAQERSMAGAQGAEEGGWGTARDGE